MPACDCYSTDNAVPCQNAVIARCFVCDTFLCEGCSRLDLTREGFVRVCSCQSMCTYALRARAARQRREEVA